MNPFSVDNFAGSSGVDFTTRAGALGAHWSQFDSSGAVNLDGAGGIYAAGSQLYFTPSGVPASDDYTLAVRLNVLTLDSPNVDLMIRASIYQAAGDYWWYRLYYRGASFPRWVLEMIPGDSLNIVSLASSNFTLATGTYYDVVFSCSGTTITATVTDAASVVQVSFSVTDTVAQHGVPGFGLYGPVSPTTGIHLQNWTCSDAGGVRLDIFPAVTTAGGSPVTVGLSGGSGWTAGTPGAPTLALSGPTLGATLSAQQILTTTTGQVALAPGASARLDSVAPLTISDPVTGKLGLVRRDPAPRRLVFDGNSLIYGFGTDPGFSVTCQTMRLLPFGWPWLDVGILGQTTQQMIDRYSATIAPLYNPTAYTENILVMWEITNDLYVNNDPVGAYNRVVSYCNLAKATGWTLIVVGCLPRDPVGAAFTETQFEVSRIAVNASIRANWRTFCDGFADVETDVLVGLANDNHNSTYYNDDATHLKNLGAAKVAPIVAGAVLGIGASTLFRRNLYDRTGSRGAA